MCMSAPKAPKMPTIADTGGATREEMGKRRKQAGYASMFKTSGGRGGDTSTGMVGAKALTGQ